MYKFLGKKGKFYIIDPNEIIMKLNWKCPRGTVDDTFKCGNTPAEAKKNYNKIQKEKHAKERDKKRTSNATKKVKSVEKQIKKITDPKLKLQIDNTRSIIEKVKLEKKYGKVSKESYNELKTIVSELRNSLKKNDKATVTSNLTTNKVKKSDAINNITGNIKTLLDNHKELKNYDITDMKLIDKVSDNYVNKLPNNIKTKIDNIKTLIEKHKSNTPFDDIEENMFNLEDELSNAGYDTKLSMYSINQLYNKKTGYTGSMVTLSKSDIKKAKEFRDKEPNNVKSFIKDSNNIINNDKDIKQSLQTYTSEAYKYITPTLVNKNSSMFNTAYSLPIINKIDEAFKQSNTNSNMTTWRGVSQNELIRIMESLGIDDLKNAIGKEVTQPIYMSTTRSEKLGKEFSSSNGFVYKINIPKDSQAIALDDTSLVTNEYEVLLNRDSKLRIDDVDEKSQPPVVTVTYFNK